MNEQANLLQRSQAIQVEMWPIDRRWQQLTGQQATLAADGRAFAQIESDRAAIHERTSLRNE
jgi:hypothetical protein